MRARRTRRNWKPNAQRKRVFSELLGRMLPLSLTTHTLRCIDKAGGARPACARAFAALGFAGRLLTRAAPCVPRPERHKTGLDAYVLNARTAELGTGVGPQLKLELQLAQQLRTLQAQFDAQRRAAATAAATAAAANPPA
jgi:ribosomal protein L28